MVDYSRQALIRDAVLRRAYGTFARPREVLAWALKDGPLLGDVQLIRRYFAEFARAARD